MLAAVGVKQRVEDRESRCGHVWCSEMGLHRHVLVLESESVLKVVC